MRIAALLAATALLATGCGGGGDDAQSDDGETAYRSPIAEYFGYDADQDPEEAEAGFAEDQRQVEALVVDCMAAQGFEYEPVDQGGAVFTDPHADLTAEERARTIGYGFTQWIDEEPPGSEFVDPNAERVEQMEPAEQEAYYAALYGEAPEPSFDEDGEEIFPETYEPTGCQGEAWSEVNGGEEDIFRDLQEEFDELYQRMEADPRLASATDGWATCMADAGYTFTTPDEIFDHLNQRMEEEVYGAAEGQPLEPELDEDGNPIGPPPHDEEGLARVREEEIAIATADYECNQEVDLDQIRQDVQVELEEAFIEEHREVFDRARATQEG